MHLTENVHTTIIRERTLKIDDASLELLLYDLGDFDVDYEYLVQEHLYDLSLVLLILLLDLGHLLSDVVLRSDQIVVVGLAL